MNNTVYIVSGFMRTGTSMMMRALEAGGLDAVYKKSRDAMRKQHADDLYDPNEGGLYELEKSDYHQLGFPKQYQGKLIKLLMGGLSSLCVMPRIKIVFMRRHVEEIAQSYEAFFDSKLMIDKDNFQTRVDLTIAQMRNRRDTEIIELWYRDVVKDPEMAFNSLVTGGWPIEVSKCIEIVNPDLCRYRKEILVAGI